MTKSSAEVTEVDLHALAIELHDVLSPLSKQSRQQVSTGDFSFNPPQVALRLVREELAIVSALVETQDVRQQSVSQMVTVLKSGDLLAGMPEPTDGSQSLTSLTPACEHSLRANRNACEDWLLNSARKKLSASEQCQVIVASPLLQRPLEP